MKRSETIRDFAPADLPRLQEIRHAAFKPVFHSFRQIVGKTIASYAFSRLEQEQAELLDRVCSADSDHTVLVVEQDQKIVAFCAVSFDRDAKVGEIDLNAVDPEIQGRGIGSWMYECALSRMRDVGMKIATVGTGGDSSHAPARRAYANVGFTVGVPSVYLYRAL